MQIETKALDPRERKGRGTTTSEQVYTLAPLFSEIEGYIKNFSLEELEA